MKALGTNRCRLSVGLSLLAAASVVSSRLRACPLLSSSLLRLLVCLLAVCPCPCWLCCGAVVLPCRLLSVWLCGVAVVVCALVVVSSRLVRVLFLRRCFFVFVVLLSSCCLFCPSAAAAAGGVGVCCTGISNATVAVEPLSGRA